MVDGREMTSEEKKKYRMAQRKLAAGKTPKESKPKEETKKESKRISLLRKMKRPKILRRKRPKTRINSILIFVLLVISSFGPGNNLCPGPFYL